MPSLSPELLSILRCPETGAALRQDGDELIAGTGENAIRYPVEDGIPLLLPASLRDASRTAN